MNAAQGTVVQKAQRMAEEGLLDNKKILSLEMFYGVRFFDKNQTGAGIVVPGVLETTETVGEKPPGTTNNEETEDMDTARSILICLVGGIREAIAPEGTLKKLFGDLNKSIEGAEEVADLERCVEDLRAIVAEDHDTNIANRQIVEALSEDQRSVEGVDSLIAKAADGDKYRSDLLTEALSEGVRAEGNDFDSDHWRTALEHEPLDFIKKQRDVWKKVANAKATPGRKTEDGDGDRTYIVESKPESKLPDKAFKTGKALV